MFYLYMDYRKSFHRIRGGAWSLHTCASTAVVFIDREAEDETIEISAIRDSIYDASGHRDCRYYDRPCVYGNHTLGKIATSSNSEG